MALLSCIASLALADTSLVTDCGNMVMISATPNTGYHFVEWNDYNTDNPRTIVVSETATYTAFFAPNQYTITFKNYDGSDLQSGTWDYGTTPVYSGTTPTKPADAQYTYTFAGWDKTISPVTGAEEYTATFSNGTNSYVIVVNGDNGTTTGGGTYTYGSSVTITASANECYHFVKWSDENTNPTRTITVSGAATYTAIFAKDTYTITVQSNDNTQGTVNVTPVP